MNDENSHEVNIYQIRVYIKGISPQIWRRILVRSDNTIADLHYTLQIAFGWGNYHLHQFLIRGKGYGITYDGGMFFFDDPHEIALEQFQFRPKERFIYEYNFTAGWELEVRVEKTVPLNPKKTYPVCIAGARTSPNEECRGPLEYMELEQQYSPFSIEYEIFEILTDERTSNEEKIEDCRHQLELLRLWSNSEEYDRNIINKKLKKYALKEVEGENVQPSAMCKK